METFEVKQEHLTLLKAIRMRWDDSYGAPGFESKRPFGNSSIDSDIAKLLGIKGESSDENGQLTDSQSDDIWKLYRGTQTALAIIINRADRAVTTPGVYEKIDGKNWYLKGKENPQI